MHHNPSPATSTPRHQQKVIVHAAASHQESERQRAVKRLVQQLEALLVHGPADSSLVIGVQLVAEYLAAIGEDDISQALRDLIG